MHKVLNSDDVGVEYGVPLSDIYESGVIPGVGEINRVDAKNLLGLREALGAGAHDIEAIVVASELGGMQLKGVRAPANGAAVSSFEQANLDQHFGKDSLDPTKRFLSRSLIGPLVEALAPQPVSARAR